MPHCKERWRNLRACLTRHLKQRVVTATDGSPAHRPYYLAEHMAFLLPYTRSRSARDTVKYEQLENSFDEFNGTSTGKAENNGETTTTYTISTSETDENNQFVTLIQTSDPITTLNESPAKGDRQLETNDKTTANVIATAPKEQVQEIFYEAIPPKRIKVTNNDCDDADMEFLRSLLPDIRVMNASQKRRFKMRIFGLIEDVLSSSNNNENN